MTEQEWLTSTDAMTMWAWLSPTRSYDASPHQAETGLPGISPRQQWLFALAVFRALHPDDPQHQKVADRWEAQPEHEANLGSLLVWLTYPPEQFGTPPAVILRDIVGNPYRPVQIDPSWLVHEHGITPHLARNIRAKSDWDRLPVLARGLENAGCTDDFLLEHLRCGGPHVKGCWALEALAGES
jgi:hypothetical protein